MIDTKTRILEATIASLEESAISKVSTIKVSKKAGTSESNIFKIFKNKQNLLVESFLYIDELLGKYIESAIDDKKIDNFSDAVEFSKHIWLRYIHFFIEHLDYAKYYSAFRLSGYYNSDVAEKQEAHFLALFDLFSFMNRTLSLYKKISFNLFWSFILDTTLMMCKRMAKGEIESSEENIDSFYHMIFDGLLNIVSQGGIGYEKQ